MKIPPKIKLIKKPDFQWGHLSKGIHIDNVEVGEIGVYFKHGYCYNFPARDGEVPYVTAKKALNNNIHFAKIYEGRTDTGIKCSHCNNDPGIDPRNNSLWYGFKDQDTLQFVCWECSDEHYKLKNNTINRHLYSEIPVPIQS